MAQTVKNLQCRRPRFNPWVGKIFWRREWLPTPVLAWRILRTEEPGGLQCMESKRGTDMTEHTQEISCHLCVLSGEISLLSFAHFLIRLFVYFGVFSKFLKQLTLQSSTVQTFTCSVLCGSSSSVQFSHSVVSDSLRLYGLQHARVPCPSLSPGLAQTHVH